MKIIFVMVNMAGGGAERVISILANRFVKLGNQVAILMTAGDTVAYELNCSVREACPAEV
jgi:GalNAc-alpha-(1->4)-GalNAc-alpha-(1->3)-diNAcBac-PP-undecaprenol alpha-1,4-N-acetyl-D-galactosaminyltransferase